MTAHDSSRTATRRDASSRHTVGLLILAAVSIAAAVTVGLSARSQKPVDRADGEQAAVAAVVTDAGPDATIDHSVVQRQALPDEPELAGASIGAYAP